MKSGQGGPVINNYHELSMRQAFGVDLRNGHCMKSPSSFPDGNSGVKGQSANGDPPVQATIQKFGALRFDPNTIDILQETMNQSPEAIPEEFRHGILQFGIGSSSTATETPIIYVNYHHKSFRDPKNWNDAEKLFSL